MTQRITQNFIYGAQIFRVQFSFGAVYSEGSFPWGKFQGGGGGGLISGDEA